MTEQLSGVVQVPSRCPVRSGAEIGLLNLRLSVSQGASLGDFLLAPACPIEKVTLWEGFLYLTSESEIDEDCENELLACVPPTASTSSRLRKSV